MEGRKVFLGNGGMEPLMNAPKMQSEKYTQQKFELIAAPKLTTATMRLARVER